MNISAVNQNGSVDKWMSGLVDAKKPQPKNLTIQESNNPVEAQPRTLPITTENVAFTVPIQNADAASAAIQNLAKNFLAQPEVAMRAQATDVSENALRLLQ